MTNSTLRWNESPIRFPAVDYGASPERGNITILAWLQNRPEPGNRAKQSFMNARPIEYSRQRSSGVHLCGSARSGAIRRRIYKYGSERQSRVSLLLCVAEIVETEQESKRELPEIEGSEFRDGLPRSVRRSYVCLPIFDRRAEFLLQDSCRHFRHLALGCPFRFSITVFSGVIACPFGQRLTCKGGAALGELLIRRWAGLQHACPIHFSAGR